MSNSGKVSKTKGRRVRTGSQGFPDEMTFAQKVNDKKVLARERSSQCRDSEAEISLAHSSSNRRWPKHKEQHGQRGRLGPKPGVRI